MNLAEREKIRSNWNDVHKRFRQRERGARDALSGSGPKNMLENHGLPVPTGGTVLDIGVGHGLASRYFHERGCIVDALDIADEACDTVSGIVRSFYTSPADLPRDEYTLAVSQLVVQHMPEDLLREQIRHLGPALRPGGIASLQFAGSHIPGEDNWTCPIPSGFDGRMCRSPEYALALVREELLTGFTVSLAGKRMEWPQFKSYWYFVRITRG